MNVTKTASDEALIEAGRIISQLRDQTPIGWAGFCRKELGISRQWANKLIGFFKGKETPAEHREKKTEQAQDRQNKVSEETAAVHHIKREEEARITKIRQIVHRARYGECDKTCAFDALAEIEELVK